MHAALLAAEETAEVSQHVGITPVGLGIGAFVVFLAALLVTYAFKSVGTRHR